MVPPRSLPLILFPGLGADDRLFVHQRSAFPPLLVPPWIDPRRHEPLSDYAARFAATLSIPPDAVIGGVSFGGMLALEMARHIPVRAVILIASCRTPAAVAPSVHRFAQLGLRMPLPLLSARLAPLALPILGPMDDASREVVLSMAQETSMSFLRWGGRAILEWPGVTDVPCPICHIHGDRDRVIPLAGVKPDVVIRGGGHVVNLTHSAEVNAAIQRLVMEA